ncbi:carbohydrate ABC transporter substrate-binding protein [Rhodobacteraceae bacterium CCMM004]|nr:carbohydrate ABC transporter substrate-binding protein [Rhodobacteraceae bacterium CCMM004]
MDAEPHGRDGMARQGSKIMAAATTALVSLGAATAAIAETELVYWSFWNEGEPQANVIQSWMDDYSALNPDVSFKVFWNGRQNQTTVRNALAGGTQIDIMDADMDALSGGLAAEGLSVGWQSVLEGPSFDGGHSFAEDFHPGLLAQAEVDGWTGQIPYAFYTVQIFYNKAHFAEAGMETPPETWEGFVDVLRNVRDNGYNPLAVESDITFYNVHWFNYLIARIAGPDFLMRAAEDKTGETWRDPAVRQALDLERALWDEGLIPDESRGYQWPAAQTTLAYEESSAALVGSWLPIELADLVDDDFEWGAMKFPMVEGGRGNIDDVTAIGVSFVVLDGTEHRDAAQDFVRFTISEEQQKKMAEESRIGVANPRVSWVPELAASEQAIADANLILAENLGIKVAYPDYSSNIFEATHNRFFLGDMTADEFIEEMVTRTRQYWENK